MVMITSFFKAMTSSWAAPPSLPQPTTTSHDDNNNNPLAELAFIALIIIIGILIRYFCTRFKPSDDSDDFSETTQTQGRDHRRHPWPRNNNNNNNNSHPQRSVQRNHGLDPAIILALPVYSYHGDDAKYQVDCAICLSEFEENEDVKAIPFCKHVFHPNCLEKWLSVQVTCPVCRGGVSTRSDDQRRRSTLRSHDVCIEIHEGVWGGTGVVRSSLVIRVMLQIKEGRVSDECKLTLILPVYRQYTAITNRFLFYAIFTSSLCFNFTLPM